MIPFFDYRPELQRLRPEIDAAVNRVLDSGRLILGAEVEALEREFARYVGVSHAVGVGSGTDALTLAMLALGIGRGDEVLTVANAGVPSVAAIRAAGATPRFVDVRPDTLLIDPDGIEAAISPETRCILPVHLYGQAAEIDAIAEIAARHDLAVVEDCAQAHGASYAGRHVGGRGRIGCFSFYPTKNVGAYGDGGLCVTGDGELDRRLRALRMYGFDETRHARVEGRNSRLDELQAAILRAKLGHLDETLEERRRLARAYTERLEGSAVTLPRVRPPATHAWHLFVVRVPDRARAVEALTAAGVGHGVHYPEPVHRMEAYRFLGYVEGDLPVTEQACRSVLSLPLYPGLEDEAPERAAGALADAT
jgi:aminotransferase EvaB